MRRPFDSIHDRDRRLWFRIPSPRLQLRMKKTFCLCFVMVVFITWAGNGFSQQPKGKGPPKSKVHPDVWRKVQEKGSVNFIVKLDMPWQWENKLSKSEIAAQRKA